jgi:GNAT superfamily N-acetyltransferase
MADPVRVEPETGRAGRRAFLDLPYRLYRGWKGWIPPLRMAEAALQDRRKNPFFEHSAAEHFLAWRGRRVVGRVAAVENTRHNATHEERIGFFGFFDVEPDADAATALLKTAADWCAARGLTAVRGPASYSTNDVCGLLVEGFDDPPTIQMPWNRPDAEALVLGAGFKPVKDLIALWIPIQGQVPERIARVVDRLQQRSGVRLRPIDFSRFDAEVDLLLDLYNRTWEKNWGFVPATEKEFRHAAKDLKTVAEPAFSFVAEIDGKPIGFSAVLRDVNAVLAPRGSGRLLPTNLFRLLFGLKRVRRYRVITLGVVPEARGKGVNEVLLVAMMRAATRIHTVGVEASWILADNVRMRAPLEAFGGRLTKTYRMYEKALPNPVRSQAQI